MPRHARPTWAVLSPTPYQHTIFLPHFNAFETVFWDSAAQRMDKEDSRWVNVLKAFTEDSFQFAWPGRSISSAFEPWSNNNSSWDWRSNQKIVYVNSRYEKKVRLEKRFVYTNVETRELEAFTEEEHEERLEERGFLELRRLVRERDIEIDEIEKTTFSGDEILVESARIPGDTLPVVPFYAYWGFSKIEHWKGVVRGLKDPNRAVNVLASQTMERSQSNSANVPIVYPEQVENPDIRNDLADQSSSAYILIAHEKGPDGKIINKEVQFRPTPQVDQNTAEILRFAQEYINRIGTMVPQDIKDSDFSGKAMRELRKIENMNTKIIWENIAVSIRRLGTAFLGIANEIYDDDRLVDLVARDGTESQGRLFDVRKDEEGNLIETSPLDGRFMAFADTGPMHETEAEETMETLKAAATLFRDIPGSERYQPVILAGIVASMRGVGLEALKKLARQDMILQGLIKPETDEEKQELQQAQQAEQQADAQEELVKAATQQQISLARNQDASSAEKIQSAQLKAAQAEKAKAEILKILSEITSGQAMTASNIQLNRGKVFKEVIAPLRNIPVTIGG